MTPSNSARPRIAFISALDAQDKRAWSGTLYYAAKALQEYFGDVVFLGPPPASLGRLSRAAARIINRLFGNIYDYDQSILLSKLFARFFKRQLSSGRFDLIFSAGSREIAFLETGLPVVYMSDTTYSLIADYYPWYATFLALSKYEGNLIERKAIQKAQLILYPSDWAADSAVKDYGAPRSRVHVLPFGANLDEDPPREAALSRRCGKTCVLLFLGVEWARKGGEIAFETMLELERMGIAVELIVCGCTPPPCFAHKAMTAYPRLDKRKEADRNTLAALFARASFMLLPTRADCSPVALCEASAHGLPAISTDTGGVGGHVKNGENGYLLPIAAGGKDYAEVIARLFQDPEEYAALARTSRDAFEARLNWDCWAVAVGRLVSGLLG